MKLQRLQLEVSNDLEKEVRAEMNRRLLRFAMVMVLAVGLALGSASLTAWARTIVVTNAAQLADCVGDPEGPGANPTANPGDTCLLAPGTYDLVTGTDLDTLEITVPNITIASQGGASVTIITQGVDGNLGDADEPCISIAAVGVTIKGVTISGCGQVGTDEGDAIQLAAAGNENITIGGQEVIIDDSIGQVEDGIAFVGDVDYSNIVIQNTTIRGLADTTAADTSNGIATDAATTPNTIENLQLSGVQVIGVEGDGVSLANDNDIVGLIVQAASPCRFNGNGDDGFFINNGGDLQSFTLNGCEANNNGDDGFDLDTDGDMENWNITNNTANGNGDDGFVVFDGGDLVNTTWTGNTANNNGDDGFDIFPDDNLEDLEFNNNTAQNNGGDGAFFEGDTLDGFSNDGNVLTNNAFDNLDINSGTGDLSNVTIRNDQLNSAGDNCIEIAFDGGTLENVQILGNDLRNCGTDGINIDGDTGDEVDGLVIDDNIITGNGDDGIEVLIDTADVSNVTIGNGNVISNNGSDGIDFNIDTSGDFSNIDVLGNEINSNGGFGARFRTDAGDISEFNFNDNVANNNGNHGFRLFTGDGRISMVNVARNQTNNNGGDGDGVSIEADTAGSDISDVTIEDNDPSGNDRHGVMVDAAGSLNNIVVRNNVNNDNDADNDGDGSGVFLQAGEDINGATIEGNTVNGNNRGIDLQAVENGTNITIDNNTANDNAAEGVFVSIQDTLSGLTITNNNLNGNKVGIHTNVPLGGTSTNVQITKNTIEGNGVLGAQDVGAVINTENTLFQCNLVTRNDIGVDVNRVLGVQVNNNDLILNDQFGLAVATLGVGQVVNAEENFWGTTDGPRGTGLLGTGDRIDDPNKADFQPFKTDSALDEPPCQAAPPTPAQADLSVSVTPAAPTVNAGDPASATVTVANNGPDAANNVQLTIDVTGGATGVSTTTPGCTASGTSVTCTIPSLGAGANFTATVNFTAPGAAGTVTVDANVTSATTDPNSANNSASTNITVQRPTVGADVTTLINRKIATGRLCMAIAVLRNAPGGATGDVTIQNVDLTGSGWTGSAQVVRGPGQLLRDGGVAVVIVRDSACTTTNQADLAFELEFSDGTVMAADLAQAPAVEVKPLSVELRGGLLSVRAQGAQSVKAEVFALNGQKLFEAKGFGGRLTAMALSNGRPLANGVYLVTVTVEKADGTITREVRKLVVVR